MRFWTNPFNTACSLALSLAAVGLMSACADTSGSADLNTAEDVQYALAAADCAEDIDGCIEDCGWEEICETMSDPDGSSHELCYPDPEGDECRMSCEDALMACLEDNLPEPSCEEFDGFCREGCEYWPTGEQEGCLDECDYANGVCTGEIVFEDPCGDALVECTNACDGEVEEGPEVCETLEHPDGEVEEICYNEPGEDVCFNNCLFAAEECWDFPDEDVSDETPPPPPDPSEFEEDPEDPEAPELPEPPEQP